MWDTLFSQQPGRNFKMKTYKVTMTEILMASK